MLRGSQRQKDKKIGYLNEKYGTKGAENTKKTREIEGEQGLFSVTDGSPPRLEE